VTAAGNAVTAQNTVQAVCDIPFITYTPFIFSVILTFAVTRTGHVFAEVGSPAGKKRSKTKEYDSKQHAFFHDFPPWLPKKTNKVFYWNKDLLQGEL
jgi:hypothetical protein